MKNLIAQFKAMGFKQFALEHVEKGVFGVVALMVLIFIAGTSWSRYEKLPEEFLKKVDAGESAIKNSTWPEAEREKLQTKRPLMDDVKKLHSSIDVSRYKYETHWFWPMYPSVPLVSEPKFLAPFDPVVGASKVIIVEMPQQTQLASATGADSPKSASEEPTDDDELALKPVKSDPSRPNQSVAGPTTTGFGANNPGVLNESPAFPMTTSPAAGQGFYGAQNTSMTPVNSRGMRFVSVRYLFPYEEQIAEFMKAMNETKTSAAEKILFLDFELERQVAVPGPKPWSGKWESVDLQVALDILDRVDFDTELVDLKYIDSVITMPLPRRAANAGSWEKYAYHPKLRKLDEEQAAAQQLLIQKAKEEYETKLKEDPFRKKGFSAKQLNVRDLRQQSMGSMPNMATSVSSQLSSGEMSMPMGAMPMGMDSAQFGRSVQSFGSTEMTQDVRTSTKFLLFRYFDFAVNPGNAYRYRVRLVLRNPNFQRPVEELVDERVAAGETRQTPWSEPTQPVYIADENRVFLAKAERPKADTGLPSANFEVFQWFADSGMNIFAKLEKLQLGQFIGGRPKTEVVRPARRSFMEEEVPIFTGSVLADLTLSQVPPELDQTEHSDLNQKVDFKKLKQLGITEKALLVDRFGQLVELDPKMSSDDYEKAQRTMGNQGKNWEHLKKANNGAGGDDFDRIRSLTGMGTAEGTNSSAGYDQAMMGGASVMSPLKKVAGGTKPAAGKKGAKPSKGGPPSTSANPSIN